MVYRDDYDTDSIFDEDDMWEDALDDFESGFLDDDIMDETFSDLTADGLDVGEVTFEDADSDYR